MAKKKNQNREETLSLDMSKGFSTGAFEGLKTLRDMRRSEDEDRREAEARAEAEAEARREALRREEAMSKRDLRFTEEDLHDDSGMTDEEIFAAFMNGNETVDVYQKKFNTKEAPKKAAEVREEARLTLSDDEREFAIFTQEMAVANVQRLTGPAKPTHKKRNKGKYNQTAEALAAHDPVTIGAAPAAPAPGMKTDYVAPTVAVTQIEKGGDVLEHPDTDEVLTASQKNMIRDVKRYEARYGMVISLRLRGLTLNAAMSRLDAFITGCIREGKPYALIICGKGLGSDGAPVIKEGTIDCLRNDSRVSEYAPALNEDGDFGSVYAAFRLKK